MSIPGPVFITGSTGYIGSRVLERLLRDGVAVRTVVRSFADQRRLDEAGVDFAQLGSIQLFAPMRQAIHTCRVAVHLAGAMVERRGNRFDAVNVDGGRMFARVAKEQAVEKAVLVTCAGSNSSARIRSQRAAEEALREAGVPFTILRFAPVYGHDSRVTNWLGALKRTGQRVPASGEAPWRPLYVDDAVEAILRSLDPDLAAGEVVEVGGAESTTLRHFAEGHGVREAFGTGVDARQSWLGWLRNEKPERAPFPVADLEMSMDPGPDGAARLGITPQPLETA